MNPAAHFAGFVALAHGHAKGIIGLAHILVVGTGTSRREVQAYSGGLVEGFLVGRIQVRFSKSGCDERVCLHTVKASEIPVYTPWAV